MAFQRAVQKDGDVEALQRKREERQQIGLATGAVIGGNDDRLEPRIRRAQAVQPFVRGPMKAEQFIQRFGLYPHGQQDRAQFQIGHAAVENGAEELIRIRLRQRPCAGLAAANFLDVVGKGHE